ncbi:unnamed protein product [Arctia plantaginis]|uniref:Uncharacterized protein n=1 Tax=Arctia plantaginis TaxID=874455 RepID=A0A8S1AKY8_ARCPL|nr:unnamed protein product [Arctia plantaginis]
MLKELSDNLIGIIHKEIKPVQAEMAAIKESMDYMNKRFDDIERDQENVLKTHNELQAENKKMNTTIIELNNCLASAEQRLNSLDQ